MTPLERSAILLRANAAISYAAMGDAEKTAESWRKLVALVDKVDAS
jgi:hypothetical protein